MGEDAKIVKSLLYDTAKNSIPSGEGTNKDRAEKLELLLDENEGAAIKKVMKNKKEMEARKKIIEEKEKNRAESNNKASLSRKKKKSSKKKTSKKVKKMSKKSKKM